MANTKITSHVIANDAVTVDMITDAAVTADKLHATLDLSGKTLTLPSAQAATTQSASDNTTKVATTAYVTTAIANLSDSAPAALNTLNEIAAALGDDANYASTTTAAIAAKLPLAGGTMTGAIAMGTAKITGLGDPTANQDAGTKTYIDTADALKLNLSGGTLTGDLILNTTTALKIPAGTTAQRPSAATGQIRWNTSDGALEVYNGSAWTAVGTGSSNKILDTFTGNGSTTAYTLSVTPANEDALIVFIDGVYQEKGDYALSNAVLTLDTAPASGEKLAVHITTASVHDGTSAVNQQFTATAGQTAFTLSADPKSENNTQVYINGVYQQKTDYAVSGTTLTFDTGLTVGDVVEVNMFTVTTLGNTDTVSEGTSNLYHTTARARGAISVSGNALSYNSSTGVITSAYEESPTFTGNVDVAGNITVGTNDTILAENNLRFKSSGASYIDHNTVGQDFIFRTSVSSALDTTALTIQHDGTLLVGTTDDAHFGGSTNSGLAVYSSGITGISRSAGTVLYVNRQTSDGDIITLRKDGSVAGSIGVIHGNNLFIGGVSHSGLQFGTSVIYPTATAGAANDGVVDLGASGNRFKNLYLSGSVTAPGGFLGGTNGGLRIHSGGTKFFNVTEANAARDGIMDIGAADARFKDLYLSGGVRLGGTGTANQLDDYEEGTWTPALYTYSGVTTSSITIYALYTKIGRICHIHAKITATLSSLPGQVVTITGLPFTAKDSGDTQQRSIIAIGGDTANTGGNTPKAHFRTSGTELKGIFWNASNNTAYWAYNGFDSPTFHMSIHGFYTT